MTNIQATSSEEPNQNQLSQVDIDTNDTLDDVSCLLDTNLSLEVFDKQKNKILLKKIEVTIQMNFEQNSLVLL